MEDVETATVVSAILMLSCRGGDLLLLPKLEFGGGFAFNTVI